MQRLGVSMLSMLVWTGSQGRDQEVVNASWKIFEKRKNQGVSQMLRFFKTPTFLKEAKR